MSGRQTINIGFPNPVFVAETRDKEAIDLGDYVAETTVVTLPVAMAEAASAVDATDQLARSVSITEAGAAADVPTAAFAGTAAISETASAVDATDQLAHSASITEVAAAADSPTGPGRAARQTINIGFPNPTFVAETATREAIDLGDYIAETSGAAAAISEAANAADATDQLVRSVSITEAAAAADLLTAAFAGNANAAVSEAANPTDTVTASNGSASITEGAGADDNEGAGTGNAAIIEAAVAADAAVASNGAAAIVEPANATDAVSVLVAQSVANPLELYEDALLFEYSYTTGAGPYQLAGARGSCFRFSELYSTGDAITYRASDYSARTEIGIGTYDASANTLTRNSIIISTSGPNTAVNWSGRTRVMVRALCRCQGGFTFS